MQHLAYYQIILASGTLSFSYPDDGICLFVSDAGKHWHCSVNVKHLPPFVLHVSLPTTYPSKDPPNVNISALWLSATQITLLQDHFPTIVGRIREHACVVHMGRLDRKFFTWVS